MGIGFKELLVILVVVLLVFGTKKLRSLGGDLGSAIKDFKKNIADDKSKIEEEQIAAKTTSDDEIKTDSTTCCDHDHNQDQQHKS